MRHRPAVVPEASLTAPATRAGLCRRSLLALGLLLACSATAFAADGDAHPAPTFGQWGVETQYITRVIAPGDDFYRHVNKGWLDTAQIPTGLPMMLAALFTALTSPAGCLVNRMNNSVIATVSASTTGTAMNKIRFQGWFEASNSM